jgi:hypothetical protein
MINIDIFPIICYNARSTDNLSAQSFGEGGGSAGGFMPYRVLYPSGKDPVGMLRDRPHTLSPRFIAKDQGDKRSTHVGVGHQESARQHRRQGNP